MFAKICDSAKSFIVNLIQVALLIAVLVAVVSWAKASPDTFQRVVTEVGDAGAALVIAGCDQIQKWLG